MIEKATAHINVKTMIDQRENWRFRTVAIICSTTYQIELNPGTHYFAMTVTDLDGRESTFSNEVSMSIP